MPAPRAFSEGKIQKENILEQNIFTAPMMTFAKVIRIFRMDYDLFKSLFWIDEEGRQILQFSTRKNGGRLIDVSGRSYFQDAGNWRLPGNSEVRFMLQSITSMTSGEQLAAISMPSHLVLKKRKTEQTTGTEKNRPTESGENIAVKAKVVAMTTQPTSLLNTVMPEGYGFCIIDRSGEVWFHSNTRRNLQENFVHEVENNRTLVSALNSSRAKIVSLDYQDIGHRCYIMPIPNMPPVTYRRKHTGN